MIQNFQYNGFIYDVGYGGQSTDGPIYRVWKFNSKGQLVDSFEMIATNLKEVKDRITNK